MPKSFRMIILASLTLACISRADAADPSLGHWLTGNGLIAGQPATDGATFIAGQNIVSSPTAPALIDLAQPASGVITLAPGSDVSLSTRATKDGKGELVLTVNKGAAQVNLLNKGPYQDMLVYSAGMVVRVKGSLLVVQHTKTDTAYVAAVEAQMAVATCDANGDATGTFTDVVNQQGVGNSNGVISPPVTLLSRPQVNTTTDIETQGTTADPNAPKAVGSDITSKGYVAVSASSWNHDGGTGTCLASLATSDPAAAVQALASISMDTAHPDLAAAAASDLTQTIVSYDPAQGIAIAAALASANPAVASQAMQGALAGLAGTTGNTTGITASSLTTVMVASQPDSVRNDPNSTVISGMVAAAIVTQMAIAADPNTPPAVAAAAIAAVQGIESAAMAAAPAQAAAIAAAASAQAAISAAAIAAANPAAAAALTTAASAGATEGDAAIAAQNNAGGSGPGAGVTAYADAPAAAGAFDSLVSAFVGSVPAQSVGTSPNQTNSLAGPAALSVEK